MTTRPPTPPATPDRRRFIDFTLPITWIVAMFFTGVSGLFYLGWMAADQKNLLRQVVESQTESKVRQGELSGRVDTLRDQFVENKQTLAIVQIRLSTLERDKK